MNLWLRLIWYAIVSRWRDRIVLPDDISRVTFRVRPGDLDVSMHMNNGRYLTLMDIGRLDLMVRSGLWTAAVRNRWTPIATAIVIRFRRELRHWQRFHLETRLVQWASETVVIEQTFVLADGSRAGQIAARALFKGGLYDRKLKAFVPIARLMAEIGATAASPAPTPEIEAFLKTDHALRAPVSGASSE
jgi:acyl-CoA thioesterase FadM